MRKTSLLVLALLFLISSSAFSRSLTGGLTTTRLASNVHTHVTTAPVRIYALEIRATAANGWAAIIETNNNATPSGATFTMTSGSEYISGNDDNILADIQEVTTKNSKVVRWPEGLACGGNMLLITHDAEAWVHYKP